MNELAIAGASNPYRTKGEAVTEWVTREPPRNPCPADYVVTRRGQTYRGFKIERELMGSLHWEIIGTEDDRACPRSLRGKYTNLTRAKEAIDQYLKNTHRSENANST
jgi:hypothetical protein